MSRLIRIGPALVLAAALILSYGCPEKEKEETPNALVLVNGEPITVEDLQFAHAALPEEERESYSKVDGVRKLLNEMVTYKLLSQEAERRNLDEGEWYKEQMERYREQLLVGLMLDNAISDADVFRYYQENFVKAAMIYIEIPEGASEAEKNEAGERAARARRRLQEGDDFVAVAQEMSDHPSSERGGVLGYVTHDLVESLSSFRAAQALFSLKEPNSHTEPFKTEAGWFIFHLLEPSGKLDPRGLGPRLRQELRKAKQEEVIRSLDNELRSRPEQKIKYTERLTEFVQELREAQEAAENEAEGVGLEEAAPEVSPE